MGLPGLLAGPILRRCDSARVCVWLVTSVPIRATGQIWPAAPGPINLNRPFLGVGQTASLRLGAKLHVVLVPIVPALGVDAFPEGQLLEYELTLERLNDKGDVIGDPLPLSSLTQSQGDDRLSYGRFPRPTFFLPTGGVFNVLHGSCRKLQGDGDDAMSAADALLRTHALNLQERPSALFLTGDQIYADDVDEALAQPLIDLAESLLGFGEKIPLPWGGSIRLRALTGGTRGRMLSRLLTPDHPGDPQKSTARNHLLGFGEFAAMYLITWNAALWPETLRAASSLTASFQALPKVRRVLANIPTYMVFDDHEVTDDWNLTRSWEERVGANPTGRRLVTNAIAAYWAFQGWGNDPDSFPDSYAKPLTEYTASKGETTSNYEQAFYPDNPDPNDPQGKGGPSIWQYQAPTTPPVLMLDTRTRRGYDANNKNSPPQLLGAAALNHLQALLAEHPTQETLILVAPTPVFGIPGLEAFEESARGQAIMAAYEGQQGAAAIDLESWHASRPGLYRLLFAIHDARPSACLILSGDVHYGFAAGAEFSTQGRTIHFTQFTSSAVKNRTPKVMQHQAKSEANAQPTHIEYAWRSWADFLTAVGAARTNTVKSRLGESPLVLTYDEMRAASIPSFAAQATLVSALQPDRQQDFVVVDSNLGQLRLRGVGATAAAELAFYGSQNGTPLAKLSLRLDRFTKPK